MRSSLRIAVIFLFACLSGMLLLCVSSPNNPYDKSNTKIYLVAKSSGHPAASMDFFEDSVSNRITFGIAANFPEYLDSIQLMHILSATHDSVLKKIPIPPKLNYMDTLWDNLVFYDSGTIEIEARAFINNGKTVSDSLTLKIHSKPVNHKPKLSASGRTTIDSAGACVLTVSVLDTDLTQKDSVYMLHRPAGSNLVEKIFAWTAPEGFVGRDSVIFIVKDNGYPPLFDTLCVIIIVKGNGTSNDSTPPEMYMLSPLTDTIVAVDSCFIRVICKDESGIGSVIAVRDSTVFQCIKSTATDSIWTCTLKGFTPLQYTQVSVIATDASPAKNRDTTYLRVKYDNDTVKPVITLATQAKDSINTNASSLSIAVQCTDTSGVLSVSGRLGTMTFAGSRTVNTTWTMTATDLVQGVFNTITVTAIDSSLRANKATLAVHIKYDSTMLDSLGPTIFQKSGPASGYVVPDSIFSIIDSIVDPSGIDSVYWTLNGTRSGTMALQIGSASNYILHDTLTKFRQNRIVIHARDNSTRHNRDSSVVLLDYNLPPVINDTSVSTNRNAVRTWKLNALSPDGDSLAWQRLTSPSTLSGAITGTLPNVTFTPATNWAGIDSFYVKVSDGYWSDTAKIKIIVIDVPVAPSIITQPAGGTKNIGQSITFTVVVNADVNPAPTYQWKHNGTAIPSANAVSYTLGSIAISDSGSYTVTITNGAGTVTSAPAVLTVNYAPSIITQPISQTLYLGKSATFSVVATGFPMPEYVWRKNGAVIPGATGSSYTISSPGINDSGKYTVTVSNSVGGVVSDTARFYAVIKSVAAGGNHTLFLKTDGRLFSCGNNSNGQLGNGSTNNDSFPRQIMTDVQAIAAGGSHSLILKANGTLFACGYNFEGQLGDGTTIDRHSPVQITTGVQAIAAGSSHSLILKTDGTLFACGYNYFGQLGDGTISDQHSPVQIMIGVQAIAAGTGHSLILTTNGTLFTCGYNNYGQLGNGSTNNDSFPRQITTDVQAIAAGGYFSLILKTTGILFACGINNYGQLGDGTINDHHSLVQITPDVQAIAAGGGSYSLILKTNGTLFACGYNNYGQLCDGTTNDQHSPVQIMTDVHAIAAGFAHSLILKTDKTVFACGYNIWGQLGDGTTTDRHTPVQISY
jgi:alpha-tubulin suppressor-like RCC1 family protein